MASNRKVFLIGPGFIGGQVLDHLVAEGYDVTTMARREAAKPGLEQAGAKVIFGTLDDAKVITEEVEKVDVVIHTATADHRPSVEAVLAGVEARARDGGKPTIYIHTSGTSLLGDDAAGDRKGGKVYHDDRPEEVDALPDSAPHRLIDLAIIKARQRLGGRPKLAIMIPPLIYGVSSREKRLSIQLPTMVRYAVKHGRAGHVGRGVSVWSQIHVADLARGYLTLLHHLERASHLENPYFFCENGTELAWGECAAEIGKALYAAGKAPSPDATTIPADQYDDLFGAEATPAVLGSNSRSRAVRLREWGWTPREKDTLASLREDEIPLILEETGPFNGYAAPVISSATEVMCW
jgi:nucleoside-diphosphate-sugar epimerase